MRRALIKTITPLSWRSSPGSLARAMRRFADVEADSGWQALQLLSKTQDPRLRAALFEIALEEAAHARMFRAASLEIDPEVERSWGPPSRESLYSEAAGLSAAVADLQVNEAAVYDEFQDYAGATTNPHIQTIFARIREDESRHGESADDMLAQIAPDPDAAQQELKRARRRRGWRNYLVGSKAVGSVVMRGLLVLAFLSLGLCARVLS